MVVELRAHPDVHRHHLLPQRHHLRLDLLPLRLDLLPLRMDLRLLLADLRTHVLAKSLTEAALHGLHDVVEGHGAARPNNGNCPSLCGHVRRCTRLWLGGGRYIRASCVGKLLRPLLLRLSKRSIYGRVGLDVCVLIKTGAALQTLGDRRRRGDRDRQGSGVRA